jgi:DNA-binding winged helix-turn-helix (wHTH) protein/tetratricopeptide (TPR) repeat protein
LLDLTVMLDALLMNVQARPASCYTFGAFRFDPSRGVLYHGAETVALPERLARLLGLLIHANGEVIDKDVIATRVWPDTIVSDGNLSQHVYMLRQILEERARDRAYVVTVRGRGYRFVAPVSVAAPVPVGRTAAAKDEGAKPSVHVEPDLMHRYSRGSYLLSKRTAGALTAAALQFEAALSINQNYVPALIGLARSYSLMAQYSYAPGSSTFPKAKAAILRALEIDPLSAEGRATLATVLLFCDWDWNQAEREMETATRLNSESTSVYLNAAWFYTCKGWGLEAMREMQRALLMEPSSPVLQLCLARIFLHTGQYRQAIDLFSALIENIPDLSIARRHRAQALMLNGQPVEALADLLVLPADRAEDLALRLPLLARAYAECGDIERAESLYQTLQELARTEFVVSFNLAMIAIALGRVDQAFGYLERALEQREPALLLLGGLPWFATIAHRTRFKALVQAIWPDSLVSHRRQFDGFDLAG